MNERLIDLKKKPELRIGQMIYVEIFGMLNKGHREPTPYEVTKVNTTSIYAKSKDRDIEKRFDKKTWISKSALANHKIWLSPEEYWKSVKN